MANNVPRPKYRKVVPTLKLNEITKSAKVITRTPLARGRDTRPAGKLKIRKQSGR